MAPKDTDSRDIGTRAKKFTLGNLAMIFSVVFSAGVLYSKIDTMQASSATQWKELQHHGDWLFRLSMKTGVDEPPRN